MKKVLSITVLAVLALVVAVAGYLYFSFGSLVKSGVESQGPRYTGTPVELGGVQASLFDGKVTINNFRVGNPASFATPHAFKVDSVSVTVDRNSLTSDIIRISEIAIEAPGIIYELGNGGSNLQAIEKNIAAAAGKTTPAAGDRTGDSQAGAQGPRVTIDHVYIRNAQVGLSASALRGKMVPVSIPDLHLTDIGKDKENGTPAAEAARQIMDRLLASIRNSTSDQNLKALIRDADGLRRQGESLTDGVRSKAEDSLKGVTDGMNNLLGR